MKNLSKVLVIIALAALVGFSMTACKNGGDNIPSGTLTISGLSGHVTEGRYIIGLEGTEMKIIGCNAINSYVLSPLSVSVSGVQVNGDTVVLNLYMQEGTGVGAFSGTGLNGDGDPYVFYIHWKATADFELDDFDENEVGKVTVSNFNNGVGSGTLVPNP